MIKRKRIIVILIITLLIFLSLSCFLIVHYRNKSNKYNRYIYPEPLHVNATLSDIVAENDTYIHFVTSNHDYKYDKSGPTYSVLDTSEDLDMKVDYISPTAISLDLQMKLFLNKDQNPLIYVYSLNSFFDEVGSILAKNNNVWELYNSLTEWPWYHSSVTRGPIFDFHLDSKNHLSFGYIYHGSSIYGDQDSPVIYNETSNDWLFLNNTFGEIKGVETFAPGDYIIFNKNIALTWTRVIDEEHSQPFLAIYWCNEGWKLYSIGSDSNQFIPIALFNQEEKINLFYYNPGNSSLYGSIHQVQFLNSTYYIDKKISETNGKIRFYYDSMCLLDNNDYLFFYSKKTFDVKSQYDVFLGILTETEFKEIQLTNTEEKDEYYINCDTSSNYIHYVWTQNPWNQEEMIEPNECIVFYNRIPINDLQEIVFDFNKQTSNCLDENKNEYQDCLNCEIIRRRIVITDSVKRKYSLFYKNIISYQ